MSTLEVACGQCEKRFRVRAEFAGRSTRCPACSAPITIAGARPAAPPPEPDERPRPRPRPRPDDDGPRPAADWKPVDTALAREQVGVLFLLASFVGSLLAWAIGSATAGMGAPPDAIIVGVMVLFAFGPLLAAGVFGIAARTAALRAPAASGSKGTAVSSLLCGIAAVGSVVVMVLAILSTMGSYGPEPMIVPVAVVGVIAAGLGALATFVLFVAQLGIARKSAEVSEAFGRTAIATCACVLAPLGISFLMALASAMSGPAYSGIGPYHRPVEEMYLQVIVVVLIPLALAALLILYHRLLAAARRAVQAGPAGRYDG